MTRRRTCPRCGRRRTAITPNGRFWVHGRPACRGSGEPAAYNPAAYWPTRHYGRHVVVVPGPDTWNPKETAA